MPFNKDRINKEWTLFLDRDGVINHEKEDDYIYNYDEFKFYDGVKEAIGIFSKKFGRIVLVTNQKGVGKGWMTEEDLQAIHAKMIEEIKDAGGQIDAIFYCTALDDNHTHRKPNAGMAFEAKEKFPEIDFRKSIIIGNNLSDMKFGRNAGMHTVFLRTTNPNLPFPNDAIDEVYNSLIDFAKDL